MLIEKVELGYRFEEVLLGMALATWFAAQYVSWGLVLKKKADMDGILVQAHVFSDMDGYNLLLHLPSLLANSYGGEKRKDRKVLMLAYLEKSI
eukprot:scaffold420_cov342-Pavlova_lutheri.AAC.4